MRKNLEKRRAQTSCQAFFWTLLILVTSVFSVAYLAAYGNKDQVYTDVICGVLAWYNGNKTAEIDLFNILIFGGSLFVLLYGVLVRRSKDDAVMLRDDGSTAQMHAFLGAVVAAAGVNLLIWQRISMPLYVCVLLSAVIFCVDKPLVLPGICFYFSGYYALFAVYRLFVFFGGEAAVNPVLLSVGAAVMPAVPMLCAERRKTFIRGTMAAQVFIPALLLVFLQSKYSYNGEIVNIAVPGAVTTFIILLVIALTVLAAVRLCRNWRRAEDTDGALCSGSALAILMTGFFSGSGAIMIPDLHHPFENIIGFSQVFEMGQMPFKEYIPPSGLYSVVEGAVFKLFGKGLYSNYVLANNIFFLLVFVLLVALLRSHVKPTVLFILSLFMRFWDYNRSVFILPILLVLSSGKLIENKNRWLKAWLLTSCFHGLYYPLYGAAVCLAFLPLGIWQAVTYVRSGELKKDVKKAKFWIYWGLCLLPVLACIPLLLGTLRHMLAMAGQSVYSDSITRFGQLVPDGFMPYLAGHETARTGIYLAMSFVIPALFVWISVDLTLKIGDVSIQNKKLRIGDPLGALTAIAPVILLPVAYTFTRERLEPYSMVSRSAVPLMAAAVMLFIYACRDKAAVSRRRSVIYVVLLVMLISIDPGYSDNESKMTYCYTVPDGYVYVEDDPVERLGTGFSDPAFYADIENNWISAAELDRDESYFGRYYWFGYYYLYGLKGAGTIEIYPTVYSPGAAAEAAQISCENESVLGLGLNTIDNYYFYNWLLTSGNYVWSADEQSFFYNDGTLEPDEVRQINKAVSYGNDGSGYRQFASAFGTSMDTLEGRFDDPGVEVSVAEAGTWDDLRFSRTVDGDDADFLYISFADMEHDVRDVLYDLSVEEEQAEDMPFTRDWYNPGKIVVVSWSDEDGGVYSMRCAMGKGKLLIPLGSGVRWLLQDHDSLTVTVEQDGVQTEVPEIGEVRLLKLKEI